MMMDTVLASICTLSAGHAGLFFETILSCQRLVISKIEYMLRPLWVKSVSGAKLLQLPWSLS